MRPATAFLYPEWQIPVQDAILETDREKFPRKVRRAEVKISERLQQIGQSSGGRHEKDAIDHSLSLLRALKDERLAG
jgi:hypothetical protein